MNTEIIPRYGIEFGTDNKSFEFNLQSENNRLEKPMKFEILNLEKGYCLNSLIILGDIVLINNQKDYSESFCYQCNSDFDYHGISSALCGKYCYFYRSCRKGSTIEMKRIFVIQMEKTKDYEELERQKQIEFEMKQMNIQQRKFKRQINF